MGHATRTTDKGKRFKENSRSAKEDRASREQGQDEERERDDEVLEEVIKQADAERARQKPTCPVNPKSPEEIRRMSRITQLECWAFFHFTLGGIRVLLRVDGCQREPSSAILQRPQGPETTSNVKPWTLAHVAR